MQKLKNANTFTGNKRLAFLYNRLNNRAISKIKLLKNYQKVIVNFSVFLYNNSIMIKCLSKKGIKQLFCLKNCSQYLNVSNVYFLVVCVYFCGVFSKVYMHIKKGEAYVREGLL